MRLARIVGFGTRRFPEKVARRLRAVNITAWFAAMITSIFVLKSPHDIDPYTVLAILGLLLVPLLHRFGPTVAPVALVLIAFTHTARLALRIGLGDGIWVTFMTAAPLSILFFGVEKARFAGALTVLGVGIVVALRLTLPFDTGYLPPFVLKLNFAINFAMNAAIVFFIVYYVSRAAFRAEEAAEQARERSDALLANILPGAIAERLKEAPGALIADRHEAASVLFADMAGFTARAGETTPEALIAFLDATFSAFDALAARHGVEKIKTTGDSYMVVSGVTEPCTEHASAIARFALDLRETARGLRDPAGREVPVRVGIASGPVVAGVVGTRKFFYDVCGDTVNMASRMETTGEPGRIQVAPGAARLLAGEFLLEPRGLVEIKGKGPVETWFLEGPTNVLAKAGCPATEAEDR